MRINIIVVGKVEDESSLEIIRSALGGTPVPEKKSIASLAEKKAIAMPNEKCLKVVRRLVLEDFACPRDFMQRERFLASSKRDNRELYYFEKKSYDKNISSLDRDSLKSRIERLVLLLGSSRSEPILSAVGYISDPGSYCWWIIFRLPPLQAPIQITATEFVSLNALFGLKNGFKPPLELRWRLSSQLAKTYGELFNSSWLHKGIRSDTILFFHTSHSTDKGSFSNFKEILSPYSRQETEAQSIDKARHVLDLDRAIYRHPNYQGEAASGYKIHYDIYSFGLVLAEVAWWMQLKSMLDAKSLNPTSDENRVQFSSKMKQFHKEAAMELQRRVIARVEGEMAFRVGSIYRNVVQWCLKYAEASREHEEEWHPSLDFNDNVVVPLESLARY